MSKRDRGLLEAAGLTIADATTLFQRKRQALYQGLSHSRDYFSARDAMVVLHDAKRRDRVEEVAKFIEAKYPLAETKLILLDKVAHEQVNRVINDADQIILVFNGNVDHLSSAATFAQILINLLNSHRGILDFIVPGEWVRNYIEEKLKLKLPNRLQVIEEDEVAYLPSFILLRKQGSVRAFFFGRQLAEEIPLTDADRLWKHFWPKFQENTARKSA
jgi:hypothetical protein